MRKVDTSYTCTELVMLQSGVVWLRNCKNFTSLSHWVFAIMYNTDRLTVKLKNDKYFFAMDVTARRAGSSAAAETCHAFQSLNTVSVLNIFLHRFWDITDCSSAKACSQHWTELNLSRTLVRELHCEQPHRTTGVQNWLSVSRPSLQPIKSQR